MTSDQYGKNNNERFSEHTLALSKLPAHTETIQALEDLKQLPVPQDLAQRIDIRLRERARILPSNTLLQSYFFSRSYWRAAIVAATIILSLTMSWMFAGHSLPGQPLYGMKQMQNQFQLSLATSPSDKLKVQTQQLHIALSDLQIVVNQGQNTSDTQTAFTTVIQMTDHIQQLAATVPTSQQGTYTAVLPKERSVLYALLQRVDWSTRLAFTKQLGDIQASVPQIQSATVQTYDNHSQITITGINFSQNAQIVLNGEPLAATIASATQTMVTATLVSSLPLQSPLAIGIQNTDGTNAQIIVPLSQTGNGSATKTTHDSHGSSTVPTVQPTSTSSPIQATPTTTHGNKGEKPTPTSPTSPTPSPTSSPGNSGGHSHDIKPPHH